MNYNIDKYGFRYYEWSSLRWTLATSIWDFVEINPEYEDYYKPKIGMQYMIYSKLRNVYDIYEITEHTRDYHLMPFIKRKLIYLLP